MPVKEDSASNALKPPPGVKVDYVHGENRGHQVIDASLISISLAVALVTARLGVKTRTRSFGWDDLVKRYDVGHHSWDVHKELYESLLNWIQIVTILYLMAIMFAKLSILYFYKRLFGVKQHFRWILYGTMGFVVAYCIGIALTIIFQCSPPSATWDLLARAQKSCLSLINIEIAIGGFNIPSDIFILLLPVPILWKLQMPLRKKLGLTAIMATGIL
ncbi:MAG: hypothetical protein Q9219_004970 [cf. Caloplaca sp. 3 TL-2023]